MSVAIPIPLLQHLPDVNVSLGVGVDENMLVYDHDTARFVLRAVAAPFAGLLATGATVGATSQAQAFTLGVVTPFDAPAADSTTAWQVRKADKTTAVVTVDTTNGRVGIGTASPGAKLEIVTDTSASYSPTSLNAEGIRIYNKHNSGGASQFASLSLWNSSDNGVRNQIAQILAISEDNNNATSLAVQLRQSAGTYKEVLKISSLGIIAIGPMLLLDYTPTGSDGRNIFIGTDAGNLTLAPPEPLPEMSYKASNNIAIGYNTLTSLTTGSWNYAIGDTALHNNTEGSGNVAIGGKALRYNTTGYDNVAIADDALWSATTAYYNIAVGHLAMYSTTSGGYNQAVGTYALFSNLTGQHNSAIGYKAGYNSLATGNVFLGSYAGYTTPSDKSIFIGYEAGFYETLGNRLYIDNQARIDEADGRTKALIYGIFNAAVASQELRFNAGKIGFGVAPVATQVLATGAGATADQIITALQNLGLVKQS